MQKHGMERAACIRVMILLWGIVSVTPGLWASGSGGGSGLAFLKVGAGARAAAMGEAYTAVATDALAAYWNPAGLADGRHSNLTLMHNRWFLDVVSNFAALQLKGTSHAFAFHVYHFNIGDIPLRSIPSTLPLETVSAQYLSMGLSYARRLTPRVSAGVTVKYLFEKIYVESAPGLAVDLGLRYRLPVHGVVIAASLQHLGRMSKLVHERTRLPTTFRAGVALPLAIKEGWQVLLATDVSKPRSDGARLHAGAELSIWKQLFIRSGWVSGIENQRFSVGVGVRKTAFEFNYSYTPLKNDLGNGQRFSLSVAL
ncbi:MAG: hypothetical protein D6715_12620 [Calditrichaeota bacterium]|nr:MAG: hypothetical protein D6715_12620 [Calditrichota bacterium]